MMGTFLSGAKKSRKRRTDSPSAHVARIGWTLVTLLYDGVLDYGTCVDRFGISRREFQRDLLKIREVGKERGFGVSRITGGRVFLHAPDGRAGRLNLKADDALETLSRIAAALGGPIERELRTAIGERPADQQRGFLQVRDALPSDNNRVGGVFAFLKDAAAGPARVEFSYTPARGARAVRRVEPYHVVARSGRYYLVAYDLMRRDWRYFALDAITGPMRKDGTFPARPVPERFLAERAIGWIRGSAEIDITVRFTSVVAAAISARTWQRGQRVVPLSDGGVEITLSFGDVGEGVRWVLGFGSEAVAVAPPEAVAMARQTVERIARHYADASAIELTELAG
jgi:predicted DNA-binding transcriptional regulator YafY